jgi:hypothetical protein
MNESKIAEFRSEADACAVKAEAATDETSKLFYAKLAEDWHALATKLECGHVSNW